jgi:hypothetical protein
MEWHFALTSIRGPDQRARQRDKHEAGAYYSAGGGVCVTHGTATPVPGPLRGVGPSPLPAREHTGGKAPMAAFGRLRERAWQLLLATSSTGTFNPRFLRSMASYDVADNACALALPCRGVQCLFDTLFVRVKRCAAKSNTSRKPRRSERPLFEWGGLYIGAILGAQLDDILIKWVCAIEMSTSEYASGVWRRSHWAHAARP